MKKTQITALAAIAALAVTACGTATDEDAGSWLDRNPDAVLAHKDNPNATGDDWSPANGLEIVLAEDGPLFGSAYIKTTEKGFKCIGAPLYNGGAAPTISVYDEDGTLLDVVDAPAEAWVRDRLGCATDPVSVAVPEGNIDTVTVEGNSLADGAPWSVDGVVKASDPAVVITV